MVHLPDLLVDICKPPLYYGVAAIIAPSQCKYTVINKKALEVTLSYNCLYLHFICLVYFYLFLTDLLSLVMPWQKV